MLIKLCSSNVPMLLNVYVNDIVVPGNELEEIANVKHSRWLRNLKSKDLEKL